VGISISQSDTAAAATAVASGHYGIEITPPQTAVSQRSSAFARLGEAADAIPPESAVQPLTALPAPVWSPIDLANFGGSTITSWLQWNVYLGCSKNDQTCWGNPEQFITDLNGSKFIHLLDQYVGSTKPKRYPLSSKSTFNSSPVGTFLSLSATQSWLHAAVVAAGGSSAAGAGNIYHLYLNQGIDVCADPSNTQCYSPDNPGTFAFCGYHSYVDFNDFGRVYYSVEPYQPVKGCFGTTSDITSATANVLSHEIFEAITDPNLDAWFGSGYPIDNYGEEIGDECVWVHLYPQKLNPKHPAYTTQNEYSNKYHSCANRP
jgi:hypothetical protein